MQINSLTIGKYESKYQELRNLNTQFSQMRDYYKLDLDSLAHFTRTSKSSFVFDDSVFLRGAQLATINRLALTARLRNKGFKTWYKFDQNVFLHTSFPCYTAKIVDSYSVQEFYSKKYSVELDNGKALVIETIHDHESLVTKKHLDDTLPSLLEKYGLALADKNDGFSKCVDLSVEGYQFNVNSVIPILEKRISTTPIRAAIGMTLPNGGTFLWDQIFPHVKKGEIIPPDRSKGLKRDDKKNLPYFYYLTSLLLKDYKKVRAIDSNKSEDVFVNNDCIYFNKFPRFLARPVDKDSLSPSDSHLETESGETYLVEFFDNIEFAEREFEKCAIVDRFCKNLKDAIPKGKKEVRYNLSNIISKLGLRQLNENGIQNLLTKMAKTINSTKSSKAPSGERISTHSQAMFEVGIHMRADTDLSFLDEPFISHANTPLVENDGVYHTHLNHITKLHINFALEAKSQDVSNRYDENMARDKSEIDWDSIIQQYEYHN
ncbi:hypothetical protein [Halobacteriovorax sp. CON-3]|uniref:hypothetical protein n=1 Tax=Halobacteriovorax sp. CON-3 TaxID=3157710 RepID=UPI0037101C9D